MSAALDRRKSVSGKAFILVVDDEAVNRRLITEILRLHEYPFHALSSGQQAWEWVRAHAAGFDLLITDVRMPGMDGRELAEKVAAVRPGVPLLFVTGFSDFSPAELIKGRDPSEHILQKPFGAGELIRKIENLLHYA